MKWEKSGKVTEISRMRMMASESGIDSQGSQQEPRQKEQGRQRHSGRGKLGPHVDRLIKRYKNDKPDFQAYRTAP